VHFPVDKWCWESFHVLIDHFCIFPVEKSFKSFTHALIGLFVLLVLDCRLDPLHLAQVTCIFIVELWEFFIYSHSEDPHPSPCPTEVVFTLFSAEDKTQDLMHVRQVLCYWASSYIHCELFIKYMQNIIINVFSFYVLLFFLMVSIYSLMNSTHLFSFIICTLVIISKKPLPSLWSWRFTCVSF
jgi:hypothetical protein